MLTTSIPVTSRTNFSKCGRAVSARCLRTFLKTRSRPLLDGNLPGPDRAILYALALGTRFRAKELRTLVPERFNLDSDTPSVTGKSCYTKNGKEAVQPLAQSLANRLRSWLATKTAGRPVFEGMTKRTSEMIRHDLKAAGIPYETDSGVVDFHSLRGDFISYLVSSGASVKTCQTLARHSTPTMTIGIYAKASLHDINGAVENLPDLSALKPRVETLRMTGTHGTVTRNDTLPLEVASDETTQVQFRLDKGPRGGMADASVLGADVQKTWEFESPRGHCSASSQLATTVVVRANLERPHIPIATAWSRSWPENI